ncbi:hypothetical protein SAY87_009344 [Trapa incisa]|uniref:Uncharacterized protein n=1 Tax=Trapa incisa TaxID=236973 RepID=A0AAN7JYJ5_9MYRT|nr:hypothetical protein SAY87_009344 [Trapa incisa]
MPKPVTNTKDSENATPKDIDNRVSGLVGLGYYDGESSRPPVILVIDDHGRASLLESVGHFRGGGDVVRAKN